MFKKYYTTGMSDSAKQLQMRFIKMRSKNSRLTKIMTSILSVMLIMIIGVTTMVMAYFDGMKLGNGTLIVDGKEYSVDIIHFEETPLYLNTDSYYIPLRKTFESLGCKVNYDVDKALTEGNFKTPHATFPEYKWSSLETAAKTEILTQLLGATDSPNKNMPIIEIVKPDGNKWYCQIGSTYYTNAWAPPVVIHNSTAYISIRAVAYFLVPDGEDAGMSILWDGAAHDTYYMGRLLWDADTMTVKINTEAGPGNETYLNAYKKLQDTYGFRSIEQRVENRNYLVCVINNYDSENNTACVSLDKSTGKIAVLDNFSDNKPIFISIEESEFIVSMFDDGTNELKEYKRYKLSEYQYLHLL